MLTCTEVLFLSAVRLAATYCFDWGRKMPKDVAAEYRARADKCRQQAEKSRDPANIAHWTKYAEHWLKRAQEADRARQRSASHATAEHPPTLSHH